MITAMHLMTKIRIYHTALAVLAVLSYLSGEWGIIHSWLGYGVSAVIVFRLIWAMGGHRALGLAKFFPSFAGISEKNFVHHPAISKALILGVAIGLIGACATGIMMDQGRAVGLAEAQIIAPAYADDDEHEHKGRGYRSGHEAHEAWEEVHEAFSNIFFAFAGVHIAYLFMFRTKLARYMVFLDKSK